MAAIEKIYGSKEGWKELAKWLGLNEPILLKYLNIMPTDKGPIALFPMEVDKWLLFHCPLRIVTDQILSNYDNDITATEILDNSIFVDGAKIKLDEINTEENFKKYGYTYLHFEYRPEKDIDYLISVWSDYKSKK